MLKTILVDDERPALIALERLLQQSPFIDIVGSFTEVAPALKLVETDNIQLIFLDIDMPKHNGITVAKKILATNADINIVFVTAYNNFAVDAFEVNATDYILKPVSKKRLDKTLERIAQQHLLPDSLALRQKQAEFFNQILAREITVQDDIVTQAKLLGIDVTHSFSFFYLLIAYGNDQLHQDTPDALDSAIQGFLDEFLVEPKLLAWQLSQGIGIIDYSQLASTDEKSEELAAAERLKASAARYFPDIPIAIGIATRYSQIESFPERHAEARNAAIIGLHTSPNQGIYHFLDSGFLPILDQYVDIQHVEKLIDSTIGKILDYDQANGTELFRTMEAIILYDNLRDVSHTLFIHYKTVLFRKQNIEKILGITLNSFSGRTMLGVALTLFYLRNAAPIKK
ncbi:MAG: putative sensor protein [Firmicutes bacterium]|nr:putative sensor protein [Bacillota bacterium]